MSLALEEVRLVRRAGTPTWLAITAARITASVSASSVWA